MHDQWPPRGLPNCPPPSPQVNGHSHGPYPMWALVIRLDERFQQIVKWQDRIERRLEDGDKKFINLEVQRANTEMPGWEIALKRPMPLIIGVAVLAVTGKLEVAVRLVEALGKIAAAAN